MAHGGYIPFSNDKGRVFYLKAMHPKIATVDKRNIPLIIEQPVKYQLIEYKLDVMLTKEQLVNGKLWRKVEYVALPKVLRNGRLFDSTKKAGEYLAKYVYHLDRV